MAMGQAQTSGGCGGVFNRLLCAMVRPLLRLRYRIRFQGIEQIAERGRSGILFLPNHPALIDPVILTAYLYDPFCIRPLADENQIDRFFIRNVARRMNVMPIPDLNKTGESGKEQAEQAIALCVDALQRGQNILLYPAGHLKHQRMETLGGATRCIASCQNCRMCGWC